MRGAGTEVTRAIAFDLDGTLVDSLPDLADAVTATLAALKLPAVDESRIRAFVGDGIDRLVERTLAASLGRPATEVEFVRARELYRSRYRERICVRSRVYPGVATTLATLRERGYALCCITNKASALAAPLLDTTGLAPLLDGLHCADLPGQRKPRPALLEAACAAFSIAPRELLMVGDSRHDLGAARAAGAPCVAVLHGYDSEVASFDADWTIEAIPELLTHVLDAPAPAARTAARLADHDGG